MMRLAYQRYGGRHGFTPAQWVATASDVAGTDLSPFFHTVLQTTDELDYTEALDWFGLQFAPTSDSVKPWTLQVRPDATPAQLARLDRLTAPYGSPGAATPTRIAATPAARSSGN
jgi:predicted metalloprotease with PDZ domain